MVCIRSNGAQPKWPRTTWPGSNHDAIERQPALRAAHYVAGKKSRRNRATARTQGRALRGREVIMTEPVARTSLPHAVSKPRLSNAFTFFPHPHVHRDRCPLETVNLAQSSLNIPPIPRIKKSRCKKNKGRRACGRLGTKQNSRLPTTTHRVGGCLCQLSEESIELTGRNAGIPRVQRELQRGNKLL